MKQILYFTAAWCGPCKMFGPVFDQVTSELGVMVQKVDVDESQRIAIQYKINAVPTLILVEAGVEKKRTSGSMTAEQLRAFINS